MTIAPRARAMDDYPALPWSRGGHTLLLCPRPHCSGSACCPEAREHLLIPVERKVSA